MSRSRPQICFLDAATLDLGDLQMGPMKNQGAYRALSNCPGGRIPRSLRNAEILVSNKMELGDREAGS